MLSRVLENMRFSGITSSRLTVSGSVSDPFRDALRSEDAVAAPVMKRVWRFAAFLEMVIGYDERVSSSTFSM